MDRGTYWDGRALSRAAKQVVKEDEDSSMMGNLQSLEQQGQMNRCL